MALSKGMLFLNAKSYVQGRLGESTWSQMLAALPPRDASELERIIAVGWYDTALLLRLYHALDTVGSLRDAQVHEHFGAWLAEHDLTTTNRLFLRLANPAFFLEKTGAYWGRFHDEGRWQVVREDKGATATLEGFVADKVFCQSLQSYIAKMLELIGAKGLRLTHPKCRGRGDGSCVFLARWK